MFYYICVFFNPSNAKLNPISHLMVLRGAHHILHVSRIRVNENNFRKHVILNPGKIIKNKFWE